MDFLQSTKIQEYNIISIHIKFTLKLKVIYWCWPRQPPWVKGLNIFQNCLRAVYMDAVTTKVVEVWCI